MSFSGLNAQFAGGLQQGLNVQSQAQQNQLATEQAQARKQQSAISPQVNALRTKALTDPAALQQLAALSPQAAQEVLQFQQGEADVAQQRFQTLDARNQARVKSVAQGAFAISQIPTTEGRIKALEQRKLDNAKAGVDSRETSEVLDLFKQGREEEANQMLAQTVSVGERLGFIPAGAKPQIKEGVGPDGQPAFFAITPQGAQAIPGAAPAPKAPLVSIGGDEASESKKLGELRVRRFDEIQTKATDAREQLASLDILDSVDVRTGASEPFKLALASIAEGFGVDASAIADVPAGQIFNAAAGKLVLGVLATQKGPQTDADRAFIAKTMARIGNAPESNEFIQRSSRAVLERAVQEEAFQENWLTQNNTLEGAREAFNKMKRDVPFVSRFVKDEEGLPVFFYQFRQAVSVANPNASEVDIQDAWKNQEIAARAAKRKK